MKKIFLVLFFSTVSVVNSYSIAIGIESAVMGQIWTNGNNGGYDGNVAMNVGLSMGFGNTSRPTVLWGIAYTIIFDHTLKSKWGVETHLDFTLVNIILSSSKYTDEDTSPQDGSFYFYINMGAGANYNTWLKSKFNSVTGDFDLHRYSNIDIVGRLPIGFRGWKDVPNAVAEFFLEVIPYMGVGMTTNHYSGSTNQRFIGSVGTALGFRFWL